METLESSNYTQIVAGIISLAVLIAFFFNCYSLHKVSKQVADIKEIMQRDSGINLDHEKEEMNLSIREKERRKH